MKGRVETAASLSRPRIAARTGGLAVALWLAAVSLHADEIYLKDGTIAYGKVVIRGGVYELTRPDGRQERFPASFVQMWVKGKGLMTDERSGRTTASPGTAPLASRAEARDRPAAAPAPSAEHPDAGDQTPFAAWVAGLPVWGKAGFLLGVLLLLRWVYKWSFGGSSLGRA